MTRLLLMTFFGERRWKKLQTADGAGLPPARVAAVMTVPMILLAVGSVGAGALLSTVGLTDWLAPSLGELTERGGPVPCRTR